MHRRSVIKLLGVTAATLPTSAFAEPLPIVGFVSNGSPRGVLLSSLSFAKVLAKRVLRKGKRLRLKSGGRRGAMTDCPLWFPNLFNIVPR
jgi:hypothetical protein